MRSLSKQVLYVSIGFFAFLASTLSSNAATDFYKCLSESGTVFGEQMEFGYDNKRNTIVLRQHKNGTYSPNFTLGNVTNSDGKLEFVFEYWANGSVAIRDTQTLDTNTQNFDLKQDFFNENGALVEHGQTALGSCWLDVAADDQQSAVKTPTPLKPTTSKDVPLICHTEPSKTNIAKSVTWCVQSALPEQPEASFGPDNFLKDGTWCEGEHGQGIGVGVEVSFEPYDDGGSPPFFDRLLISNGNDETPQTFIENSRVKRIEIKTDDGQTFVRDLNDEMGIQEVLLGDLINPRAILVTILDVYPGQLYEDTCLSHLKANFDF